LSGIYAATYVRSHGTAPKNKDEGLIGQYTAKELGYNYSGLGQGDAEDVTVTISYDDLNNEATATVEGQTVPFFSQILGKDNLSFSAKSVVKYQNVSFKDPASIVLILSVLMGPITRLTMPYRASMR